MQSLIALVRAVNVGGIKLLSQDLAALCEAEGFADVRTLLASGNAVFATGRPPADVAAALAGRLTAHLGRPAAVFVRTAGEMHQILAKNPFAAPGNTVAVVFLDAPPPPETLEGLSGRADETVALGTREIYVHYPSGMGRSKLRIPGADRGTARNLNTVAKLAALADG